MSEIREEVLKTIKKNNIPKLTDEVTLALRGITEKRASTVAYMIKEAKKRGLDDEFARAAIQNYGVDGGHAMKTELKDVHDLKEFANCFTSGLESRVYEMETKVSTEDEFEVNFHYCPYVNRWMQMDIDADEMATFCEICMEGDRAISNVFEDIEFHLGNTIAKGGKVCEVHYRKAE
ncbi:MAG: L-2-amino-thiazoline-4-carboxylic acid hydrolase [Sporolactobacillus sp.]